MFERLKCPALALVMGGFGALLLRWQAASAFEEVDAQQLDVPGAPATVAVTAFFILTAAVFLLMARRIPVRPKSGGRISRWDLVFAAGGDTLYLTAMVLSGLLTLASAPLLFREASALIAARKALGEGDNGLLQLVLAVCAIPACAALVASARNAYRMKGRSRENGALLLPVLMDCFWLLECYRANAADPVVWHYLPQLLAVACGLLFYLDCAGLAFELGHARRMLWLAAMTVAVSITALASLPGLAASALLGGQLLAALAALWVAPGNLRRPPAADRFGLRALRRQDAAAAEPAYETDGEPAAEGPGPREIQEDDVNV